MSVTASVWVALYCGFIVAAFLSNPIYGALGYLLEYYMRPELKWWGDELPVLRYNLIVSMALGASFLIRRNSLPGLTEAPNIPLRWLLSLASVMLLVIGTVALDRELSWGWFVQWFKMAVIFPMLVVGVLRSRKDLNLFLIVNMLGAFWWGWEAWQDPHRSAGRLVSVGSGDSLDDNGAAAHLLTVLPFIAAYLFSEKDKKLRAIALLAAPFVVNTIILCNSRGSMVGLSVAGMSAIVLVRSGYRLRMAVSGVLLGVAFYAMADEQFIERQQSTANYQEDGSANDRLLSWRAGYQLIKDRPFGSGGRGFHLLSPIYIPTIVARAGELRAPHNTFVMVGSEWGVAGLVCFLGFYGSALLMLQRVKRRSQIGDDGFFYWRALATQTSIIGFLVAGMFTDRLYAEAGYWMVGIAVSLNRVQLTELSHAQPAREVSSAEPASDNRPRTWQVAHP